MRNCAAVIAEGAVRLIVVKEYLPTYNEFYERRWFAPGPEGQTRVFDWAGARIGVEICEELWTPAPPSSRAAMSGAQVIVNLSASDDLIGKYDYLRTLVSQQSARCLAAYAYASAGYGESSTDLVYSGKAMIAERGTMLAENDRWSVDDRFVIADIDIQAIEHDRANTSSFADAAARAGIADTVALPSTDSGRPHNPLWLPDYRHIDRKSVV